MSHLYKYSLSASFSFASLLVQALSAIKGWYVRRMSLLNGGRPLQPAGTVLEQSRSMSLTCCHEPRSPKAGVKDGIGYLTQL